MSAQIQRALWGSQNFSHPFQIVKAEVLFSEFLVKFRNTEEFKEVQCEVDVSIPDYVQLPLPVLFRIANVKIGESYIFADGEQIKKNLPRRIAIFLASGSGNSLTIAPKK